jgi:hypothetical protein
VFTTPPVPFRSRVDAVRRTLGPEPQRRELVFAHPSHSAVAFGSSVTM